MNERFEEERIPVIYDGDPSNFDSANNDAIVVFVGRNRIRVYPVQNK